MRSLYDAVAVSPSARPNIYSTSGGNSGTTGLVVDTKGHNTAMIVAIGTVSVSNPAQANLLVKLEESDSATTGFTAALDNSGTQVAVLLDVKGVDALGLARVEGLNANRKRYLRLVTVSSFGGGTNPQFTGVAIIALDRKFSEPVNTTVSNT